MNPEIAKIVKALALTENGGKVDTSNPKAGQSGEMKSIFQFTPGTWKMYSKEISGQDNLPMNAQNEAAVVYGKVQQWLDSGLSPQEIASTWNSGKPDAYLQDYKGTNKYGVQYDTPGYVKKFDGYLKTIEAPKQSSTPSQTAPTSPTSAPAMTAPAIPSAPTPQAPPVANPIPKAKTLPQLLQRQIKPL